MRALLFATTAVVLLAGCGEAQQADTEAAPAEQTELAQAEEAAAPAPAGAGAPAETREPNATGQVPVSPDQARAPVPATTAAWRVEEVASGLANIWAFEFLPDGAMLVTERGGTMRIVGQDGTVGEPISGLPEIFVGGQAGLLDVALAPDFATSNRIFFAFSEPRDDASGTSVASATLNADRTALEDVEVIFQADSGPMPLHYGSRIAFAPDGQTMFVTLGERFAPPAREQAPTPNTYLGKVIRMNLDGSVPADNPFADGGGEPLVWSYGHRNPQGATISPDGVLWTTEHGPQGGDELNHPEAGKNYGWPFVVYGEDYSGDPMYENVQQQEGVEQPVYFWDPVIAPSGMEFYTGDLFPEWQGDLFIGGMSSQKLVRLTMENGRVTGEEWLPMDMHRIRDVQQGPDGALYLATDDDPAVILRVVPE
jgi:glucose/arabinose dehydrogenase